MAAVVSDVLGHAVLLNTIAGTEIEANFKQMGFSESAADAFGRMTKACIEGMEMPEHPVRRTVALVDYLRNLAQREAQGDPPQTLID